MLIVEGLRTSYGQSQVLFGVDIEVSSERHCHRAQPVQPRQHRNHRKSRRAEGNRRVVGRESTHRGIEDIVRATTDNGVD